MDRETAKLELKDQLADYVRSITSPDPRAGRNMYKCPLCGSGNHGSRNSNGAFSITGTTWHCFSCNKGGDLFDLIGEVEHIDGYNERLKRAASIYGVSLDAGTGKTLPGAKPKPTPKKETPKTETPTAQQGQFEGYINKCAEEANKTDYFIGRGFTPETVSRFNLGYDAQKQVIVIPYDKAGSYYITRSTEGKEFRKPSADKAGAEPVYNVGALYVDQPCFVCESPIDAISIMQAGGSAVAIGGTGVQKLMEQLKKKAPASTLVLCFDNDNPGREATEKAEKELTEANIKYVVACFTSDQYSGEGKDANDLLRANEEQLKEDIRQNIKTAQKEMAFIPYRVSDYITNGSFDTDISYFKQYKDRKTGFANIDHFLTLYPGMAALGGSASLGKSTFAVNLADNLIKAGETVLYFALEQEPIELITKSVSRRLYEKNPTTHLRNIDIKNGATAPDLEAVKREYAETADRFIIVRCNFTTTADDIKNYVEGFIQANKVKPIVIIDYLQLISPPLNFRGDTRTATDYAIKLFKTMQTSNELFVLLISNFNRSSYDTTVSYEAFKETGMIEFTCDYIWGLQLSVLEDESFYSVQGSRGGEKETSTKAKKDAIFKASRANPKEVEFVSLKSRNGKQVYKAFFKYDMEHDVFIPDKNSPHMRETGVVYDFDENPFKKNVY